MPDTRVPQVVFATGGTPPDCVGCGRPIDRDEEHALLVEDPARRRTTVIAAAHQAHFVGDGDDVDDACLRALRRLWADRCAEMGWHCLVLGDDAGGPRFHCGSEALHAGTPMDVLLADGHRVVGTYEYTLAGGIRPWLYFDLSGFGAPRAGMELPAGVLVRVASR